MQVGDRYLEALSHRPRARRAGTLVLAIAAHVGVIATVIVAGFWHVDEMPSPPHTNLTVLITTPPTPPGPPTIAPTTHGGSGKRDLIAPTKVKPLADVPPATTPEPANEDFGNGGAGGAGGGAGGNGGGGGGCIENCGPPVSGPPKLIDPEVGKARRIGGEMPHYSDRARAAGVEGTVVAKICVSPAGTVSSATLLRGLPLLDETVLNAVRGWRYKPFTVGDKAMPFCYVANFEFHLQQGR